MPGFPGGSDGGGGGGLSGLPDGGRARALVDTARLIHIFGGALSGSALEPPQAPLRRPGRLGLRTTFGRDVGDQRRDHEPRHERVASPPRRAEVGMSAAGRHRVGTHVAGAEVETS